MGWPTLQIMALCNICNVSALYYTLLCDVSCSLLSLSLGRLRADYTAVSPAFASHLVVNISSEWILTASVLWFPGKERRMGQKVAELLEEKCKVLETLSECEHKVGEEHA